MHFSYIYQLEYIYEVKLALINYSLIEDEERDKEVEALRAEHGLHTLVRARPWRVSAAHSSQLVLGSVQDQLFFKQLPHLWPGKVHFLLVLFREKCSLVAKMRQSGGCCFVGSRCSVKLTTWSSWSSWCPVVADICSGGDVKKRWS